MAKALAQHTTRSQRQRVLIWLAEVTLLFGLANTTAQAAITYVGMSGGQCNAANPGVQTATVGTTVASYRAGSALNNGASSAITTSATFTLTKPTGTTTNDLLIASIALHSPDATGATTITEPAGWTLIRRTNQGTNKNSISVYRKLATSSEPASYDFTIGVASPITVYRAGGIAAFINIDTTTPIDVEGGQVAASSLTHATPSITTTVANTIIVTSHAFASASNWTPPAGMTEIVDKASNAASATGETLEMSYVVQGAAGATGTKSAVAASDADTGANHIMALRSAPGVSDLVIDLGSNASTGNYDQAAAYIAIAWSGASAPVVTPPAGWTLIRQIDNSNAPKHSLIIYRKLVNNETPPYTFTATNVANMVGGIVRVSAVDSLLPLDVESGQTTASSLTHTALSLSGTRGTFVALSAHAFASASSFTPPAGWTENIDTSSPTAANATGITLEVNNKFMAGGATGNASAVAAANADIGSTHMMILNGSQCMVGTPGGTVAGDVMIASISVLWSGVSAPVANPQPDWTLVRQVDNSSPARNSVFIYSRVATGSEPPRYDFSFASGYTAGVAYISTFRGVDTTAPIDVESGQATASATTHATPNITTRVADTMLVATHGNASGSTWTPPAGMTEIADATQAGSSFETSYVLQPAAGATGAKTATATVAGQGATHLLALQPIGSAATTPTSLNIFEVPSGTTCAGMPVTTNTGPIYTKIAGSTYSLCVVSLDNQSPAQIQTAFNSAVKLEVVPTTNCLTTGTVYDTIASTTLSSGRATPSFSALATAYPDLSIRISYPTTSPTVTRCSTNNFSVRPTGMTVTSSNANADNAGASTSATPILKTDASFGLTATAIAGYSGTPVINASNVGAHSGAIGAGTAAGTFGSGNGSGVATGAAFTYSEVGYFRFTPYGVYDATYTAAADQTGGCRAGNTCDCITTTTDSNTDGVADNFSNTLISGKYGCDLGNTANTNYFGRFVPDHFTMTTNTITATCGFLYMDEPTAMNVAIEARNSSNALTSNYTGSYATATTAFAAENNDAGTNLVARLSFGTPTAGWSNGVYTYSTSGFNFTRNATPDGPYDLLSVGISLTDGEVVHTSVLASLGLLATTSGACGGACTHKTIGSAIKERFGRLKLDNAYGSELLNLHVALKAQYWNGSAYITNTLDNCTSLVAGNVTLGNYKGALNATNMGAGHLALGAFSSGVASLKLTKPSGSPPPKGSVDLAVQLGTGSLNLCPAWSPAASAASSPATLPYLRGKWCSTAYTYDPAARATFGISKNSILNFKENF